MADSFIKRCIRYASQKGYFNFLPDKTYLKLMYRTYTGNRLNLKNPVGYTEKLQWLKLFDRNPEYTKMVDKLSAKEYISELVGKEYVASVLGVYDDFVDIDFDALPDSFVLKSTHDSGGLCVCPDKSKFDFDKAKEKIRRSLNRNYYLTGREWPYKDVKPKIFAEEYLNDETDGELRDYKFFTFSGEPKVLYIAQGRNKTGKTYADFFDMDFNHLDICIDHEQSPIPPHKPENFELMKELAVKLSKGTPQLRVDFYEVSGKVYVGELTFFHCNGFIKVTPDEWEKKMGEWVKLPEKKL